MKCRVGIIALILTIGVMCLNVWYIAKPERVVFVRSAYLVENYAGMKEARNSLEMKYQSWYRNIDTLTHLYNMALHDFDTKSSQVSPGVFRRMRDGLKLKEQNLNNYTKSVEKLVAEENEKLTQGALNQINSYIKKYAEENDIKLVVGVTISGNVLYGSDDIDITDEILEGLNKDYK